MVSCVVRMSVHAYGTPYRHITCIAFKTFNPKGCLFLGPWSTFPTQQRLAWATHVPCTWPRGRFAYLNNYLALHSCYLAYCHKSSLGFGKPSQRSLQPSDAYVTIAHP